MKLLISNLSSIFLVVGFGGLGSMIGHFSKLTFTGVVFGIWLAIGFFFMKEEIFDCIKKQKSETEEG